MAHLHNLRNPILHGDFKVSDVLIPAKTLEPKISNFGLWDFKKFFIENTLPGFNLTNILKVDFFVWKRNEHLYVLTVWFAIYVKMKLAQKLLGKSWWIKLITISIQQSVTLRGISRDIPIILECHDTKITRPILNETKVPIWIPHFFFTTLKS